MQFFQLKNQRDQRWLSCKIDQSQPRLIIYINIVVVEFQLLHTKFQGNHLKGSGEKDFLSLLFTVYGHDGHFGHATWTNNKLSFSLCLKTAYEN